MADFLDSIATAATSIAKEASQVQSFGKQLVSMFGGNGAAEFRLNEQDHLIEIFLDNSGSLTSPKKFPINPAGIKSLVIRDTVNDWVTDGEMVFLYQPEDTSNMNQRSIFGQIKKTILDGIFKNNDNLKSYNFRGDGFDLLRVLIMPKTEGAGIFGNTQLVSNSLGKIDMPAQTIPIGPHNTNWMLSHLFSITEMEDVSPQTSGTLFKEIKIKFHDVRYQMLKTSNIEYSTAMPKDSSLTPITENEIAPKQGVLFTGDAMRDILNHVLTNTENGGTPEFQIKSENWDKGSTQIFYTSPAQYSAQDDLEYLYGAHASQKSLNVSGTEEAQSITDLCLMHTQRAKTFGGLEELHLTPVSAFFEKAGSSASGPGPLQKEHFFIGSYSQESFGPLLHRAPMGGDGVNIDVKLVKGGQILSYCFLDMSPQANSEQFCNKPVCSVNIGKREFKINFERNSATIARKVINEAYLKHVYKLGSSDNLFLPTLHKTKKSINTFPVFSANGTNDSMLIKNGLHNLLYTGLFQNACINFTVLGSTLRESGTFIGIDKTEGCDDNDYNNKLFGQWFVVQVNHIITMGGVYMNEIFAVKLHRFREPTQKFDNTLASDSAGGIGGLLDKLGLGKFGALADSLFGTGGNSAGGSTGGNTPSPTTPTNSDTAEKAKEISSQVSASKAKAEGGGVGISGED